MHRHAILSLFLLVLFLPDVFACCWKFVLVCHFQSNRLIVACGYWRQYLTHAVFHFQRIHFTVIIAVVIIVGIVWEHFIVIVIVIGRCSVSGTAGCKRIPAIGKVGLDGTCSHGKTGPTIGPQTSITPATGTIHGGQQGGTILMVRGTPLRIEPYHEPRIVSFETGSSHSWRMITSVASVVVVKSYLMIAKAPTLSWNAHSIAHATSPEHIQWYASSSGSIASITSSSRVIGMYQSLW